MIGKEATMTATIRALTGAMLLLAPGCLPQSHLLLEERTDGAVDGGTDAGAVVRPTADCEEAMAVARQADPCVFGDGMCLHIEAPHDIIECMFGRWVRTRCFPLDPVDGECTEDLNLSPDGYVPCVERVAASAGCVDLDIRVGDDPVIRRRLCEVDPLPGVRPDAVGSTPWTACANAIATGTSGDPCVGDFMCIGHPARMGSDPHLAWCDGGVLRVMLATHAQYQSECTP
jgi:hypothetical protein